MKGKMFVFLCCIAVLFCSCSSEYSVDGYENFQTSHSHYELNNYILPTTDFVDSFQNIDIAYFYREEYKSMNQFVERSFVVINYEKAIYEQAKEYCLQNMQLSDSGRMEYNGYRFFENIKLAKKQNRYENPGSFPHWFNMFAYNDNRNCLIFMGFYNPNYSSKDAQNVCDNWGEFIEKYFSDIYDWRQEDSSVSLS